MGMGGTERLIYNLVRNMDRSLFSPMIAWFYLEKVLPEFEDLNVPLYHVPKEKRIDFKAMKKLAEIVEEQDIHVVNAHHFLPFVYSFYGAKIRSKVSLVYTEHSEADVRNIPWKWRLLGKYILHKTDFFIGISDAVTDTFLKVFDQMEGRHRTIKNGVDLEAFKEIEDKDSIKKTLGLPTNEVSIGIVANFRRNKNHLFLLKAFHELLKRNNTVRLFLIGQGFTHDPENSEGEIRQFISTHGMDGKVVFTGYRPDVSNLLKALDIFCLTSYKEGLPIAMIEAMASSLPVVGTDVEGIRDVVVHGENGFLVEVENIESMVSALGILIENADTRKDMGRRSRELAMENYSLQACLRQYEALFRSIAS